MLKKIYLFYLEAAADARDFMYAMAHYLAYACLAVFWLFLFQGIAQLYPEPIADLLSSSDGRAATVYAGMLAVFIPHFCFSLLLGGKKLSTMIWNSVKFSFMSGIFALIGLQFPISEFNTPYFLEIVLTVFGMILGLALSFTFYNSIETTFLSLFKSKAKKKREFLTESEKTISALKYARRHAATALADETDYKAALEDILAETDGLIQYLPEGEV